ncbi:MAG: type VI secretion system contractile sheath small subunit, partial [Thermodesulfovibrionia bacterium]|nr:type VI secretion system contractile sheath small subunit [Thermodesulfovibrionia bacterium]
MKTPVIPFQVLALAPFRPPGGSCSHYKPIQVDTGNMDEVMEGLGTSLYIHLPETLCREGGISVNFRKFRDFHPDNLIKNIPFLNNLLEAGQFVEKAKTEGLSDEKIYERLKEWPELPVEIKFEQRKTETSSSGKV